MTTPFALVVDDDPTMRLMLESTLERLGVASASCADGRAAVEAFGARVPDLVLLDIGLPDVDGFEVCRALRRLPAGRDTPVLVLTAHEDAGSIAHAYEAGATDFIAKPVNWEILGHRLRYILRSARVFAEAARGRERLAAAQRVAGIGSWEWNLSTDAIEASEEALRILGRTDEARAREPSSLDSFLAPLAPDERADLRGVLVEAARSGRAIDAQRAISLHGHHRVLHLHGEARAGAGDALVIHGTVQDVSERHAAQERIRHLAYHDLLTGLPNRTWLAQRIDQCLARAQGEGGAVALMLLDIDQFKRINDTLGHAVGDQLLAAVAQRLAQPLRRREATARTVDGPAGTTALSRLGGDEFCVVLEGLVDAGDVARLAERVRACFTEPFALSGHHVVVTPSIGIAQFPQDAADSQALLQAADMAMYDAKTRGGNRCSFYSPSMSVRALHRVAVEAELRRALSHDELVLHYQPIVAAGTRAVAGLEALVRWEHPERGLLLPGDFIGVAEESQLIVPLGERVLDRACAQIAAWRAQGLAVPPVAVNISGAHFREPGLAHAVQGALRRHGVAAAGLKLEITESVLLGDVEAIATNLARARETGVRLSIDDFGTGYSSLGYLKRLPVDELKLDRSFVADIGTDRRSRAIVTAVVRLARSLSLAVVAEGVETVDEAAWLTRVGCPCLQGHYFHRAAPPERIAALLRAEPVPDAAVQSRLVE